MQLNLSKQDCSQLTWRPEHLHHQSLNNFVENGEYG